jgi:hypothetical protein
MELLITALTLALVALAFASGYLLAENRRLRAAAAVAPPAAVREEEPSPEILAVITAAIATMLRHRRFQIRRVRFVSHSAVSPWVEHGRSMIHASHRPGRR